VQGIQIFFTQNANLCLRANTDCHYNEASELNEEQNYSRLQLPVVEQANTVLTRLHHDRQKKEAKEQNNMENSICNQCLS